MTVEMIEAFGAWVVWPIVIGFVIWVALKEL